MNNNSQYKGFIVPNASMKFIKMLRSWGFTQGENVELPPYSGVNMRIGPVEGYPGKYISYGADYSSSLPRVNEMDVTLKMVKEALGMPLGSVEVFVDGQKVQVSKETISNILKCLEIPMPSILTLQNVGKKFVVKNALGQTFDIMVCNAMGNLIPVVNGKFLCYPGNYGDFTVVP